MSEHSPQNEMAPEDVAGAPLWLAADRAGEA